jgi:hypothetical protein
VIQAIVPVPAITVAEMKKLALSVGAMYHHSIVDGFDAFSTLDQAQCLQKIAPVLLETGYGGGQRMSGIGSDTNGSAVSAAPLEAPTSISLRLSNAFVQTLPLPSAQQTAADDMYRDGGRGRVLSWLLGDNVGSQQDGHAQSFHPQWQRHKKNHEPVLVNIGGGSGGSDGGGACWQVSAFSATKHPYTISVTESGATKDQQSGSSRQVEGPASTSAALVILESTSPAELALLREAVLRRVLCHLLVTVPAAGQTAVGVCASSSVAGGTGVNGSSRGRSDLDGDLGTAPFAAEGLCQLADRLQGALSALLDIEDEIHVLRRTNLQRLSHTVAAVPVQTEALLSRLLRVYFQVRQCSGMVQVA